MTQHGADSSTQREIEKLIVEKISKNENLKFEKKYTIKDTKLEKDVKFEFDFYNEEERIIGEIYAGIDKISAGSKKKVITDCFKMVFAEKLLGYECNKRLIFVHENIKKSFEGDSWINDAIKSYGIKVSLEEISEEQMKKLRASKKLQQRSNQK